MGYICEKVKKEQIPGNYDYGQWLTGKVLHFQIFDYSRPSHLAVDCLNNFYNS